nr:hypothetical protein [Acidipropionibacterium acidipropionici]
MFSPALVICDPVVADSRRQVAGSPRPSLSAEGTSVNASERRLCTRPPSWSAATRARGAPPARAAR